MREFNIQLPPKFEFTGATQEERDRELEEYLTDVSRILENSLLRLFRSSVGSAETPTAGNLPKLDEDGYIVDSGVVADDVVVDSDLTDGLATKANKELDNLVSVAINISLISDTDNTDDLGSAAKEWKDLYIDGLAYIDGLGENLDFNQKQALQLVIENRTSDPASPVTGQIWMRTDL